MDLLRNAELWVFIGLLLFAGLMIFLKVPTAATKALDSRAEKIRAALDEAERLRAEAAELLESLKHRRAEAETEAARMLADAEAEARRFEADAKTKLEAQIVRRTELADRRIAAAEAQASADVRRAAAELAVRAAGGVLAARLAGQTSDPLVDRAVAELPSRLQ